MNLEKLKNELREAGYTQMELAAEYGIDQGYLSKVLNGKKRMYIDLLLYLSEKLARHPATLFFENPLDAELCSSTSHLSDGEKKDLLTYLATKKIIETSSHKIT